MVSKFTLSILSLEILLVFSIFYLPTDLTWIQPYRIATIVTLLFVWFSMKFFKASLETEDNVISYDLISANYAKSVVNSYREIAGYRISSILSIVFFSIFIFTKLFEEASLSNILEVLLIFGGVISLQIYHLLDLVNREPEVVDVDEFVKRINKKNKSSQVKIEGIISQVEKKNFKDFELIHFQLVNISGKHEVKITYIHRAISAAPQILEGSRIRLFGNYFASREDIPATLKEFPIEVPEVIIVEGYGIVEEVALLYDETSFEREYSAGMITINTQSMTQITDNVKIIREFVKVTEIGEIYTIDDLVELMNFSEAEINKFLQLMVKQGYFEIIDEPTLGYKRLNRNSS